MVKDAKAVGTYRHPAFGKDYSKIQIATVREMIEDGRRLDLPFVLDALKAAKKASQEDSPLFE
jgi:DhnA family fructose-bisphosphate aldolase class Ia